MATEARAPSMRDLNGSIDQFNRWLENFSANAITLTSAVTGIPAGAVNTGMVGLANAVTAWEAAYDAATNVATRTPLTVNALKVLRHNGPGQNTSILSPNPGITLSKEGIRGLIKICQAQPFTTLSGPQRRSLGITDHEHVRSAPPVPHEGPNIIIDDLFEEQIVIRYFVDPSNRKSKAKPPGVKDVLIQWTCDNGTSGAVNFSKCPCWLNLPGCGGFRVTLTPYWHRGNGVYSKAGASISDTVPLQGGRVNPRNLRPPG
jgi:hypothetical protein